MTNQLEAISMEPVKEKLNNLKQYLPDTDDFLCNFGKYFATVLNKKAVPQGFNFAYEISIQNIKKGNYGEKEKMRIPSSLTGQHPSVYNILRETLPEIAKATCPPEFAEKVIEYHNKIMKSIK